MNKKTQLWLGLNKPKFYLIPRLQIVAVGQFPIQNLAGEKKMADQVMLQQFELSKEEATLHFKETLSFYKDTILEKLAQQSSDPELNDLLASFAPLLDFKQPYNLAEIEQAAKNWFDNTFTAAGDTEKILDAIKKLSAILPEKVQEDTMINQLGIAIENKDLNQLAQTLSNFAQTLKNAPDKIHTFVVNGFAQNEKLHAAIRELKPTSLKNFNRKLSKKLSNLAKDLQQPKHEIDLDAINKKFEQKIYDLLKMEHPDKKQERQIREKYNKEARENIQISLKKTGFKSFSDFRKEQ